MQRRSDLCSHYASMVDISIHFQWKSSLMIRQLSFDFDLALSDSEGELMVGVTLDVGGVVVWGKHFVLVLLLPCWTKKGWQVRLFPLSNQTENTSGWHCVHGLVISVWGGELMVNIHRASIHKHWIIQWKKNSGRVDQNNMTWRGRKRVAGLIRFWNRHPILWNIVQTWPKFMRVFVSEENVHIVLYQVSPCGFPWKLGQEARCQSNCRCAWNAKHIANAGFCSTFFLYWIPVFWVSSLFLILRGVVLFLEWQHEKTKWNNSPSVSCQEGDKKWSPSDKINQ